MLLLVDEGCEVQLGATAGEYIIKLLHATSAHSLSQIAGWIRAVLQRFLGHEPEQAPAHSGELE